MAEPDTLDLSEFEDTWRVLDGILPLAGSNALFPKERSARQNLAVVRSQKAARSKALTLASRTQSLSNTLNSAAKLLMDFRTDVTQHTDRAERLRREKRFDKSLKALQGNLGELYQQLQAAGLSKEAGEVRTAWQTALKADDRQLTTLASRERFKAGIVTSVEATEIRLKQLVHKDNPVNPSSPLAKAEQRLKESRREEQQHQRWLSAAIKELKSLRAESQNNGVSLSQDLNDKRRKLHSAEERLQKARDKLEAFQRTGDPMADALPVQAMNRAQERMDKARKALDAAIAADGHYRHRLGEAIAKAQSLSPSGGELATLLSNTGNEYRLAHLESSMGDISSQIRGSLKGLDRTGSSVTTHMTVSLGVTFGDKFKSINKDSTVAEAGVKATVRVAFKVERGADNTFIASVTHAESIDGTTTFGPARLNLALGGRFGEKRTYDSIEALLQNESVIVKMTPRFLDKRASEGKPVDLLLEVGKLRRETAATRRLYQQRLHLLAVLDEEQELAKPIPYEADVTVTRTRALHGELGATLVQEWKRADWDPNLSEDERIGRLGVSGALVIGGERERITHHRRVGYFDEVRSNHVLQEIAARSTPQVFGFEHIDDDGRVEYLKGERATGQLQALSTRLRVVNAALGGSGVPDNQLAELRAERDSIATRLQRSMQALEREYDSFINLANKIDTRQVASSAATREQLRRNLGQRGLNPSDDRLFVNTLKRRALKPADAAQYIRAMSLQLSALARTYQSAYPQGLMPPSGRELIKGFGDKLRTPALAISSEDLSKHLSFEARTEPVTVTTTSVQLSGSFAVAPPTNRGGEGEGVTTRANINAAVGFQYSSEKAAGSVASQSLSVTVALGGGFSVGALALGEDSTDGGGNVESILPQRVRDKLKSILQRNGDSPADVDSFNKQIRTAIKALANPLDPSHEIAFSFSKTALGWKLVTAETIARHARGFQADLSIPTPVPGLHVSGSMGASQNRVFVKQRYYAATTLSTLTSSFRDQRASTQADDEKHWKNFLEQTELIPRCAAEIDAQTVESGADFVRVLAAVKDGDMDDIREHRERLDRQGASAGGLVNDMQNWLLDMALSDDADAQLAAKRYVEAFTTPANNQRTRNARMAKITSAMEALVRTRVRQEEQSSSFHTLHNVSREDIQDYAFSLVNAKRKALARSLGASETDDWSIEQVQANAASLFSRIRLGHVNDVSDRKAARMLRQAMALEYVGETIVDLTEFNSDEDKNKALTRLMDELPRTLDGKGPNIHMGEFMTGELVYDENLPDGLKLVRRVKEGHQDKVTNADIRRTEKDTKRRFKKLDLNPREQRVTYRDLSGREREYDPDNANRKSRRSHYKAIEAKARRVTSRSNAHDIKHRVKKGYARHKPSDNFSELFKKWMKKKRESDERQAAARLTRRRRRAKEGV